MANTVYKQKGLARFRLSYTKTTGLLLIAPWLLGFVLLKLLPILASFGISFTDFYMLTPEETGFIGLENYGRLMEDGRLGFLIVATLSRAVNTVPLQVAVSIALAALLSSPRLKAPILVRTLFFLPSIIPAVAITFMFFGFVDPATGWLNRFIMPALGLDGLDDVYNDVVFQIFFTISSLWAIGPGMLIMMAAMQSVSSEIQEAARVDGAGPLVRFFQITLPMTTPAIFFTIVINLIAVFGGVVLLDRGGGFRGGAPFNNYISYWMFDQWDLGYAATVAWFFFVVVMIVVIIIFSTSRRWVYFPDQEASS